MLTARSLDDDLIDEAAFRHQFCPERHQALHRFTQSWLPDPPHGFRKSLSSLGRASARRQPLIRDRRDE